MCGSIFGLITFSKTRKNSENGWCDQVAQIAKKCWKTRKKRKYLVFFTIETLEKDFRGGVAWHAATKKFAYFTLSDGLSSKLRNFFTNFGEIFSSRFSALLTFFFDFFGHFGPFFTNFVFSLLSRYFFPHNVAETKFVEAFFHF